MITVAAIIEFIKLILCMDGGYLGSSNHGAHKYRYHILGFLAHDVHQCMTEELPIFVMRHLESSLIMHLTKLRWNGV
jgi:hypothetical protein